MGGHKRNCQCLTCVEQRMKSGKPKRRNEPDEFSPWRAAGATIGIASTVYGTTADPSQLSDTTQNNYAESSQERQSDRRSQDIDEGTRDAGSRSRWIRRNS